MSQARHKFIACFIAFSLCVPFFYITRQWAITNGHGNNAITPFAFEGLDGGIHGGHFKLLSPIWKPRVGALCFAEMWLDIWLPTTDEGFKDACGAYHTLWFGATLFLLIFTQIEPVFLIFIVWGATVYAIQVTTYNALYDDVHILPWDFPAMFFWALAFILWQKQRFKWMVAVIIFGTLFKESVALLAVLLFFAGLGWRTSVLLFSAAFWGCLLVKLFITQIVLGNSTVFTAGHSSFGHLGASFLRFWKWELHPHLNTILWADGGLCIAAFLFPVKTLQDKGIITVLALFWILLTITPLMDGSCYEVRHFSDIIPILAIFIQQKLYPRPT